MQTPRLAWTLAFLCVSTPRASNGGGAVPRERVDGRVCAARPGGAPRWGGAPCVLVDYGVVGSRVCSNERGRWTVLTLPAHAVSPFFYGVGSQLGFALLLRAGLLHPVSSPPLPTPPAVSDLCVCFLLPSPHHSFLTRRARSSSTSGPFQNTPLPSTPPPTPLLPAASPPPPPCPTSSASVRRGCPSEGAPSGHPRRRAGRRTQPLPGGCGCS